MECELINYIMHRWYGDGEVLIVLENAQQQLSCCKGYVEAQESVIGRAS